MRPYETMTLTQLHEVMAKYEELEAAAGIAGDEEEASIYYEAQCDVQMEMDIRNGL